MPKNIKNIKNKLRQVLNAIGIVFFLLLLPLLVANITLIAKSFIFPDKVPDFLGYKPFIVLSGSMEPTISEGDLILTCALKEGQTLQKDDIIAYRYGQESVITHRIVEVQQGEHGPVYITQGDNNNAVDRDPVTPPMVEGIYLYRVAGLGRVAMFLQTPLGLVLVVGGPFLLYLLADTLVRRRARRHANIEADALKQEVEALKEELARRESEDQPAPEASPSQTEE
ncbi:MAG TPA: signal peptidase I [Clostridiales bacterium]|jgi:signal peptidase|nr:signal peptidase I [Clostridiales bacterium]